MASIASVCRTSSRGIGRQLRNHASSRAFTASAASPAAHNFTMPAMSPTMTEGNISSWKVKEGDKFSAGDVLLEIETDKAQMDVEAQDDGQMAKIMQGDGSKAVKVGARIGVLADSGDDLSTLEIPPEDSAPSKSEESSKPPPPEKKESSPSPPKQDSAPSKPSPSSSGASGTPQKQNYPLYPSVQHLLHTNGLSKSDADTIPATGPNGRLLKGDVLAHLGHINKSAPADVSSRITKLSHLDLSNIKLAAPKEKPKEEKAAADGKKEKAAKKSPEVKNVALPIRLTAVLECQKRLQDTLGVTLPLSEFIARAVDLANEELPRTKGPATADELFDSLVGVKNVYTSSGKTSRGGFVPEINTPGLLAAAPMKAKQSGKEDIMDVLAGGKTKKVASTRATKNSMATAMAENVFSVNAKSGEEKRARVFLERVKSVLEVEPGRLVL
ncbi:hypothetical protein K402DRAFT_409455 [Aulographum hederae CBS 113979]|uniref:Pyruvate dehydrogenase protein x component n=1 Tax=Aulographum hederae CBS 113979 TaxID=1176131 RepID=A0A6G1HFZ6_9PEZI|nr:hypothetical protein K402DRAFT_409455 [Aulographum hederae CBS 113979]